MGRIRTIKPAFFRHEGLQDLETENPGKFVMLTFAGLWTLCDSKGKFEFNIEKLKPYILPKIKYDLATTINILIEKGFIIRCDDFTLMINQTKLIGTFQAFYRDISSGQQWHDLRQIIFERDGKICCYCGAVDCKFHIDHRIALSKGGTNSLNNLCVACAKCNIRKKDSELSVFLSKYNLKINGPA